MTNQACARPPICSNCPETSIFEALAGGLRRLFQGEENPLAAAAGARRFDDDANAGRRATRGNRDFGAVAERSDAGAKARLGCAPRPTGDDDRAAVVAVGGPPAAPGRRRLAAPLRHGRRARRAGGSWARRRSFSAIGEAVERRAKAEGERGGASDRNAARRRRRVAGAGLENRAALRSCRPSLVRSAHRARRRARTLRPVEFSALWTVFFWKEGQRFLRGKNVAREECEAWR